MLSVLHRLGAEANLTYAQPDNVDITVVRQSGDASAIDVKTLTGTANGQWKNLVRASTTSSFLSATNDNGAILNEFAADPMTIAGTPRIVQVWERKV